MNNITDLLSQASNRFAQIHLPFGLEKGDGRIWSIYRTFEEGIH